MSFIVPNWSFELRDDLRGIKRKKASLSSYVEIEFKLINSLTN